MLIYNELCEVSHNFTTSPGIRQHSVGNTSVRFNKAADALTWIHQLLEAVCYLSVIYAYCTNFNSTIAHTRGQARGFKSRITTVSAAGNVWNGVVDNSGEWWGELVEAV